MFRRLPVVALSFLVSLCVLPAAEATAQTACGLPGVTVTVSPAHPAPGQPVTVTLHNNSGQLIQLPSSCTFESVHSGSCTGALVFAPLCLLVITPIPAGSSSSMQWNQTDGNGQQVPNGTYGIAIRYYDAGFNPFTCCALVTIGCGSITRYGTGCPDSSGRTPALSGSGCAAAGGSVTITANTGLPGAPAVLLFGLGRGSVPITPSCALEIAPLTGIAVPLVLSPSGGLTASATLSAATPAATLTMQLAALDLSLGSPVLAVSNALELQVP